MLDFKDLEFSVNIRDIHKIEKNNYINVSIFWLLKSRKKSNICIKKCFEEKCIDLLIMGEEGKRHYVLIKDFNTFLCDHSIHRKRKHFCCYCLHAFNTEEILKCHIKD